MTFLVADDVVGEAPLVDGIAELQYDVPPGSDAKVAAEYAGDSNFTDSSDSITRRDPLIDASLTSARPLTRFDWYGKPVTVRFTCTAGSAPVVKCPGAVRIATSDADAVVERTIHAEDGGVTTLVMHIKIDLDKPTVRVRGVRNGAVYPGKAPKPECVASDKLSGIASCKITREKAGDRVRFRAVATDKAGNTAVARGSYRLLPSYVKGTTYRNGFFVVNAGQSYRLVAKSVNRPRYFYATPWPATPFERGPRLERVGKQRWAIRISITDDMAARARWNVGIKYGGELHVVKLRVR